MRCFRITERIKVGLPVELTPLDYMPFLPKPPGSSMDLRLDDELSNFIRTRPYAVQLEMANIEFGDGYLLFRRISHRDKQAFVRIETAAGVNGKVRLMSGSYTTALKGGTVPRVYPQHHPFPDAGVLAFCTKEELARVNKGVEFLDVLVLLHQGARFRIQRTGDLQGASPWLDVRWTGNSLTMKDAHSYAEAGRPLEDVAEAAG